jgi:hypothetical protein
MPLRAERLSSPSRISLRTAATDAGRARSRGDKRSRQTPRIPTWRVRATYPLRGPAPHDAASCLLHVILASAMSSGLRPCLTTGQCAAGQAATFQHNGLCVTEETAGNAPWPLDGIFAATYWNRVERREQ